MADPSRLDELKRKFEENPKRYFAPLANEYRKAGEPELAIELCRTYLPQQPTHMSGYIVYGQALHDAGRSDEAAAVFKQALTLDPENIIALRQLGDIARDDGDRGGAMRWYGKVLELDPRNEEIASYIGSLAQPGTATSRSGPERQSPPRIRPEPAPDEAAVRLEDIVAEPDTVQPDFTGEASAAARATPEWEAEFQDTAGSASGFDPEEPFEVTQWPDGSDSDDGADEPTPVLEGPWHSRVDSPESGPESGPDAGEPVEAPLEEPVEEQDDAAARQTTETGDSADDRQEEPAAPTPRPASSVSPFVTETLAELYVQQGLHGEALVIYRELALRRDDPALHRRIAELEAAGSAQPRAESVRDFFVRIRIARPSDRGRDEERPSADSESPLASLFGSPPADATDLAAAQRLSGAFAPPRSGDSHR